MMQPIVGVMLAGALICGCVAAPPTVARQLTLSPHSALTPSARSATGDPLQRRTLDELRGFVYWLDANDVEGFIGEVGWPGGTFGDAATWNRLADLWYDVADEADLPVSAWAAGAHWDGYPLAVYRRSADRRGATTATQARVLEAHPGGSAIPRGIAVAGGSFGDGRAMFSNRQPGRVNQDYWYPERTTMANLARRGFDFVRIDFRWERIQPTLYETLDAPELERLGKVVSAADAVGLRVVLDLHNYGEYRRGRPDGPPRRMTVGSNGLPAAALIDVWRRLSRAFDDEPAVLAYGLMNEPHNLGLQADEADSLARWDESTGGWTGPLTHDPQRGHGRPGALRVDWDGVGSSLLVSDGNRRLRYCARNGPLLSVWVYLPADARSDAWTASVQLQDVAYDFHAGPHVALEPGSWTHVRFSAPTSALGSCRAVAIHITGPTGEPTNLWLDDLEQRGQLLPAQVWEATSQAVVGALRERGDDTPVLVAGHNWSKVQTWSQQHPRAWIVDPAGATRYEAHHYWDAAQASDYRSYRDELRAARSTP